jgi:indoleamine 2,3-dioxygenase
MGGSMMEENEVLQFFEVDRERGFLPAMDPLEQLPPSFEPWEGIARMLPKLLAAGKLRATVKNMPHLRTEALTDRGELERTLLLLSYFGHAYVWGEPEPPSRLPEPLAVPWYEVSQKIGRPPVLSYASYALHNWRRLDPDGPIALGNLALLQNFLGGLDEEWFILVHVDIEAKAAPALTAIVQAQKALVQDRKSEVERCLLAIAASMERIYETLSRMPEGCDPYIYFHRVRPYIHGWKDHPVLRDGLIYEGVSAHRGKPQQFRGETGAQSSIIPSLDAALGISHGDDPLKPYLLEMRAYMPPRHRAFVETLEQGPSIRAYVQKNQEARSSITEAYNRCVLWVERFRTKHLEYAGRYIHKQSLANPKNPNETGTGGTPFLPYLKKHRDETAQHQIGRG